MLRTFAVIFLLNLSQESFGEVTGTTAKDLRFKLHSGDLMPLVGLGTFLQKGEDNLKTVLDYALAAGYRLIDTAGAYENEEQIGTALKELLPKHNLTRKDIFITTKLNPPFRGEQAYEAMKTSLKKLDSDYIDLYLIHWPGVFGVINETSAPENSKERDAKWKALVKGKNDGLARNIGVSNYNVRQLKELLANDYGVKPALNQVEWHPFNHQQELLDLCNKEGILLQAYFSLGGGGNKDLLQNSEVKKIADKLGKTPAQVLLRWSLQQNISIIPKASSQKRIEENIDLDFTIPDEDMKTLNNLNQKRYAWNPDTIA